ncbi:hypothetical protein X956_10470 [Trueperella pyogenes TP8]|nr:hypothetical protein X956_10470 [Trueperella pyogenes TP8]
MLTFLMLLRSRLPELGRVRNMATSMHCARMLEL